jgi:lipopolysaccharide export system protein LptC
MTLALPINPVDDAHRLDARKSAAYAAARRHTRLVAFLRKAIPIGAAVSFVIFTVFPFINPFRPAGVTVGAIRMDGTRVTMENPRMAGHRKDNRPYEVTAVSAVQDIRLPNVIELNQINGRMETGDDAVVTLSARSGVFDSSREQMTLKDDILVRTKNGQEVRLRSADVDFKAGTVRSREPVVVSMPDMEVRGDTLDVTESGAKIVFTGRVSALISEKGGAAQTPGTPTPGVTPASSPTAGRPASPSAAAPASPSSAASSAAAVSRAASQPPSAPALRASQPAVTSTPPIPPPTQGARGVITIDPATGRIITP